MKIKILHISDLHVTPPFKSLEDIWLGASTLLKKGDFSFIIVSGDLSQAAEEGEYTQLLKFAEDSLLPLLSRSKERQRIIFVPGNHDVNWKAKIGQPFSVVDHMEEKDPESWVRMLQSTRLSPRASGLRMRVGRFGHLEFLELSGDYPQRMKNVQKFLTDFYQGSLHEPSRMFDLLHEDEGEDWSAHVFPEEGVAFYGFNSCFRNDRYWTGAGINPLSIYKAQQHAAALQEKQPGRLMRIAVWHHGLRGEQGRPDYLEYTDLGSLYNAGFRIGFHGHTHRSESHLLDRLFSDRFVVISTGSLGAGSPERPDAVGNQFSIVHVYPGQVKVEVFERDGLHGVYSVEPKQKHLLTLRRVERRRAQSTQAESHTRTCKIYPDGLAQVEVELRHLEIRAPLILAVLEPPFCDEAHDETAETESGPVRVQRAVLPDGRVQYSLHLQDNIEWLRWSYRVSNALPLTEADVRLRGEPGASGRPRLETGSSKPWSHKHSYRVRFPCEALTLALKYVRYSEEGDAGQEQPQAAIDPSRCQVIAEYEQEEGGHREWKRDPVEEERYQKSVTATESELQLRIEAPQAGYRYTLSYGLKHSGLLPDKAALEFAAELLSRCRDSRADAPRASAPRHERDSLTVAVGNSMRDFLAGGHEQDFLSEYCNWVGYLWHDETRRLLPCFGQFAPRSWGVRFARGAGVVGHAFRFNWPAGWQKQLESSPQDGPPTSLIYQPTPEFHPWKSSHQWVVALPLLLDKRGPSIGVLGISCNSAGSSTAEISKAEEALRKYVSNLSATRNERKKDLEEFGVALMATINLAFWEAVGMKDLAGGRFKELSDQVLNRLELRD